MNLSIVCSDEIFQCSIRTIEKCSNLCATLFSDLCRCSATLHTPSLAHDAVRLAVSLLEDVLAAAGRGWHHPGGGQTRPHVAGGGLGRGRGNQQ